jgi:hypothetical protein
LKGIAVNKERVAQLLEALCAEVSLKDDSKRNFYLIELILEYFG